MSDFYHTALRPAESTAPPAEWWSEGGSFAFVHDASEGLPGEYCDADLIYAEVPWADGHVEFQQRAGTLLPVAYGEWCYKFSRSLVYSGKPWIVVGGLGALRHMACQWFRPIRLNGSQAMAFGANCPVPPGDIEDAEALLCALAGNPLIGIVGDPCAGYGRTARIFARAGKAFIVSDVNPLCIGHIAQEAPGWLSGTS